jgi:hypothetical protein
LIEPTEGSEGEAPLREVRVVLLAGMGGGTGGGTVIDVAAAVHHVAERLDIKVTVDGVLMGSPVVGAAASGLATANMFALLAELRDTMQTGTCGAITASGEEHPLERPGPPFDAIYLVAHPGGADAAVSHAQLDDVARYLAWSQRYPLGVWLDECRQAEHTQPLSASEPLYFRTLAFSSLSHNLQARQQQSARQLQREVWDHWLADQQSTATHVSIPRREPTSGEPNDEVSVSREERLRGRFGDLANTRFAHQATTELVALWPTDPAAEVEDTRVLSAIKRLAAMLELRNDELAAGPLATGKAATADLDVMAGRAMHQLLARPQWNTYDPPQGLKVLDELVLHECTSNSTIDLEVEGVADMAVEGLQHAAATALSCGFERRTLVVLPKSTSYDGIAESISATRPTAALLRTETSEAWIATEGCGVASQSLAVRLAHIHPDIAEAASRLYTRADIEWNNPLHVPQAEAAVENSN